MNLHHDPNKRIQPAAKYQLLVPLNTPPSRPIMIEEFRNTKRKINIVVRTESLPSHHNEN